MYVTVKIRRVHCPLFIEDPFCCSLVVGRNRKLDEQTTALLTVAVAIITTNDAVPFAVQAAQKKKPTMRMIHHYKVSID
jgi:hypothetical protein